MTRKNIFQMFLSLLISAFALNGCQSTDATLDSALAVKSSGPHGSWVCGCGGSCTSTAGDGIPDTWKTIGIDVDCTGTVDLDLGALGASPLHKDIFIQVDTLADRPDHSVNFTFTQEAKNYLVAAFENAPVPNPDGTTGIHLHIFTGNAVSYSKVVTLYPEQAVSSCSGSDVQVLSDLKSQSMTAARAKAFHYALIADYNTCDSVEHCAACPDPDGSGDASYNSTGISIMHGKDFIVSVHYTPSESFYSKIIAGTLMHELGHNFGLHHGGGDEDTPNYKPNYISVMNYRYQFGGVLHTDGVFRIDYSREVLNTLDESHLDEYTGLGSSDPTLQFTFMDGTCTPQRALAHGPVDWNGDGEIDSYDTSADLNPQEDPSRNCGDRMNEMMVGHEDWSVLDYGFYNQAVEPYSGGAY